MTGEELIEAIEARLDQLRSDEIVLEQALAVLSRAAEVGRIRRAAKATPEPTDPGTIVERDGVRIQRMWCQGGGHFWERSPEPGRPPTYCPEHPETRPAEAPLDLPAVSGSNGHPPEPVADTGDREPEHITPE